MEIHTVGYAGTSVDQFLAALTGHEVERLIDIRELPISRKRGFAKAALRDRLGAEGIAYEHFRILGSPKPVRDRFRKTKNDAEFFAAMDRHLENAEALDAIASVIELAERSTCCLMCYCPNWEQCHRRAVVDAIAKRVALTAHHIVLGDE